MEFNNNSIDQDMLQIIEQSIPKTEYFAEIATSLAETANELDSVGSPLALDVDSVLNSIVNTIEEG